jgi:hypothetical protein
VASDGNEPLGLSHAAGAYLIHPPRVTFSETASASRLCALASTNTVSWEDASGLAGEDGSRVGACPKIPSLEALSEQHHS